MNLYLRLLSYVKPYWKSTVVSLIAMLIVSIGNLVPTWISGRIVIDEVIVQRDISRLHWIALLLLGIYLIKSIAVMLAEWLSHEIAEKIIYDMRTQIYSHLQKLSFRFHKDSTTGDLMSRVVNDIDAMRDMLAHTIHIIHRTGIDLYRDCYHTVRYALENGDSNPRPNPDFGTVDCPFWYKAASYLP